MYKGCWDGQSPTVSQLWFLDCNSPAVPPPSKSALCCWRKVHIHENRPLRERTKTNWVESKFNLSHPPIFLFFLTFVRVFCTTLENQMAVLHKPNRIVEAFTVNAQELTFGASDRYRDIWRKRWDGGSSDPWRGGGQVEMLERLISFNVPFR